MVHPIFRQQTPNQSFVRGEVKAESSRHPQQWDKAIHNYRGLKWLHESQARDLLNFQGGAHQNLIGRASMREAAHAFRRQVHSNSSAS